MASKSSRQRKLERARVERRLARQAHRARRKRQVQAGIGASLALVLIVLGVTWALGGFDSKPAQQASGDSCLWVPTNPTGASADTDTGTPPSGELHSGFETMSIKTNLGDIEALLDTSKAPCAAASFKYLGEKAFFNGSSCHRLNTDMKTLTCGDPKSDGTGGPSYQFADEDIPTVALADDTPTADPSASPDASPSGTPSASSSASPSATSSASPAPTGPRYYAKGTIIMVNSGANTNGSQFMIVYGDGSTLGAAYSIVGTITKGLELVEQVAQGGIDATDSKPITEGKPKTALTIQQLTVALPGAPSSDAVPPSSEATPTPASSGAA